MPVTNEFQAARPIGNRQFAIGNRVAFLQECPTESSITVGNTN
jgi:hypothetical protein